MPIQKRKSFSGENNNFYGKHHTKKTKELMSKNHYDCSGKNNPFYGKKHIEKTKKKMSKNHADIKGKRNPSWKGGLRSYYQKLARKKLRKLGFEIKGKDIHLKNGDYKDNRIKNLAILFPSKHTQLHWKQGDIR